MVYRMHKHASGLPPLAQRHVARAMVRAARMGQSTRDIELYLAFTPGLDGGRRYADAFLAGAVSAFQHYAGDGMDQEDSASDLCSYRRAGEPMKRSNSGGMIRQHPARGLWEARYVGADGRRHSLYAKTRREAQERLRGALTDADHGIRPIGNCATVAAYLEEWLVTLRVRPRTAESYADTVRRYVIPAVGGVPLCEARPGARRADGGRPERLAERSRRRRSATRIRPALALGRALKTGRVVRTQRRSSTRPREPTMNSSHSTPNRSRPSSRRSMAIASRRATSRPSGSGCGKVSCSASGGPMSTLMPEP